ncbi:MAG: hypothetical protein IKU51_03275 [Clostridia bacterium]|nr:hypothetical protein [Clostridia bacterium]
METERTQRLAGLCMLLAFLGYLHIFIEIYRAERDKQQGSALDPAQMPEKG